MDSDKADWKAIKTEYVTTGISQRELAKKYGVSLRMIGYRSRREKWVEARELHCDKVAARTIAIVAEKTATTQANRLMRIGQINDKLLDILEDSAEQITRHEVRHKVKTKEVKYQARKDGKGKPVKEVIREEEQLEFVEGDVDRAGLKHLTASMKNIADTYLKERDARKDEDDAAGVAIKIQGASDADAEAFSG